MSKIRPQVAQGRIESFAKRFGVAHLYLAYHAAFPLALTPDLLYGLWANFQQDIHGEVLGIPWIAVADLLLSSLCDEVGHELYEMDLAVRNELLRGLQSDKRFGKQRINQMSDFLLEYVQKQLQSHDPDIQDFAKTQQWIALAYTQPSQAARELALAFSQLDEQESAEMLRMASLTETFAEPLAEFQPLLIYARGMGKFACGNLEAAKAEFGLLEGRKHIKVTEISLPIPEQMKKQNIQPSRKLWLIAGFFLGVSISVAVAGLSWWWQNQNMSKLLNILPISTQSPSTSNDSPIDLKTAATDIVTAYASEKLSKGDLQSGLKAVEELLNRNALANAQTALKFVSSEHKNNPSLNFLWGRLIWQLIQTQDKTYGVDDARRYWEYAINAEPNSPLYAIALGFAYYAEGNIERANNSWFKAIDIAIKQNTYPTTPKTVLLEEMNQNPLTAYAGFAIGIYKTALEQPAARQEQYLNEAIKLRQMVLKQDPTNFQINELAKNWLWTEEALKDWQSLLQEKSRTVNNGSNAKK
ncbi:MAG: hypothetical protein QNJ63_27570 [Calothrix sp. MO_192.B10]|nr:hypothetical protein [Calothrix sp. MO_192.B10]